MANQTEEIRNAEGKLLKTISMKDGIPDGDTQIFDENEQLTHKLTYDHGKLSGPAKFFFSGKPLMFSFFKDGLLDGEAILFSNGIKVGTANFKKGLFDGEFTSFDSFGSVLRIATYTAGQQNGECKSFYPDGKLMEHSIYKDNQLDGEIVKYFPSGNIMEISIYKDGKPCCVDIYDENGNLKSRKEIQ